MSRPLQSITGAVFLAINIALVLALINSKQPQQRRWLAAALVSTLAIQVAHSVRLISQLPSRFDPNLEDDPHRPTVVASLPNEMNAAAIVASLETHGIKARAVGGFTAGFQTEIASDVKVVVAFCESTRARELIRDLPAES